jgi:hypothetical protein
MRTTALARWKANPQPLVTIHPAIAGRRAAVRALSGEATIADAFREEVLAPLARAWLVHFAREIRRDFDRKARKRKRAARARCGYKR